MTDEEYRLFDFMITSKNEQEWVNNCAIIKSQNNGNYPTYWFDVCIRSGLLSQLQNEWKQR